MAEKRGGLTPPSSAGPSSSSSLSLPTANTARRHLGDKKKSDTKQVHPGYSMFDWNKLCSSGEVDLTGTQGKMLKVTPEELAKHKTDDDLWTAVRGVVYNVTHFARFHPGGKGQLRRGAGVDCTELFDQVHVYVNSEAILERCIVGYLVGAQPPTKSSSLRVPVEKPAFSGEDDMDDDGVDVVSMSVPSTDDCRQSPTSNKKKKKGGSKMTMAHINKGSGPKISIADAGKLQKNQSSLDDNSPISIPIPTMSVQTQDGDAAISIPVPVLGSSRNTTSDSKTVDSATSGITIPVPDSAGGSVPASSIPVLGSSAPSHITDHPLISKTAYETSV